MNPVVAVRRGARLLDRELPRWTEIVDVYTLDLGDCERCVLGQLFRDFNEGGLRWLNAIAPAFSRQTPEAWYGFDVDRTSSEEEYLEELTRAWRAEIVARKTSVHSTGDDA